MRNTMMLVAALAVAGFGCSDSSDGNTGGSGGSGGSGATGGTGGTGNDAGSGGTGGAMTQAISIKFAAMVGDEPFVCGDFYDIGTPPTEIDLADFRFFVEGVEVRNSSDEWVAITLNDTNFQAGGGVLLDFENGCADLGNEDLNDEVAGTVPTDTYNGVRFTMGLPFDTNHANPATAPPPLNLTSMHWNWQGGYKFLRIDSAAFATGGWRMHLGSTGCDGDPIAGGTTECTTPNLVTVEFEDFDPDTGTVYADAALLVEGQDLSNLAPMPPGCMSGPTDLDCTAIFANLGLPFDGAPGGDQQFFRAE